MFIATENFIVKNNRPDDLIIGVVIDHLKGLKKQFQKYFASNFDANKLIWGFKPYATEIENVSQFLIIIHEVCRIIIRQGFKL